MPYVDNNHQPRIIISEDSKIKINLIQNLSVLDSVLNTWKQKKEKGLNLHPVFF
jgi:hypothetical protein